MDLHYAILYALVTVGSVLLLLAQFSRKFRRSSLWFRWVFLLGCVSGIAWSALGSYLALHRTGGHTTMPWSRFWFLHCTYLTFGGVALGMLVSLVLSPEFYRRVDRRAHV
jgi:hypothetical protein